MFGIILPNFGVAATKKNIHSFSQLSESLQYTSIWTTDHILMPRHTVSPKVPYDHIFESILTLGYIAGITERIKLGTSVIVLPMRNPILLAKQIATLDALSDGRVILGLGVGWNEPEFKLLSANFKKRGLLMTEYIKAIKTLWTQENPVFNGQFIHFNDVNFSPKPIQKPHPPIWIGGYVFNRIAELGDGWHPSGSSPHEIENGIKKLKTLTSRPITVSIRLTIPNDFKSNINQSIDLIESYKKIGVNDIICGFGNVSFDQITNNMKVFDRDVISSFI